MKRKLWKETEWNVEDVMNENQSFVTFGCFEVKKSFRLINYTENYTDLTVSVLLYIDASKF